jgi:regulator of protease activity HflC (stomatin/prohibitin superfamily)
MIFTVFFAVLIFFLLIAVIKSTYLVRQAEVVVIERLGCFYKLLGPGIHFVIPFLDQKRGLLWPFVKEGPQGRMLYRYNEMLYRIDLRETVYDFPKQNVITKDNVTIEISALLYFQITDPKAVVYEVANLPQALEKLAQTTMRDIIGAIDLDQTLTSRNTINEKLRFVLDVAADKWGVKVNRVELQEINPPADIKEAMEMQMRAERDRRALILEAEGQKSSAILKAEGDYQSKVIRAKGEAESRLIVSQAEASAIKMIQDAVPDQNPLSYMVAQNYIKMLPEITSDKNGKLILLPYESSALMGSLGTIKELFNQKDK